MKRTARGSLVAVAGAACFFAASPASAQAFYIGSVILTGASWCPAGMAEASGQIVPISGNDALFSLYNATYGGDGRTTFALPKLTAPIAGMRYCIVVNGVYPQHPTAARATPRKKAGH